MRLFNNFCHKFILTTGTYIHTYVHSYSYIRTYNEPNIRSCKLSLSANEKKFIAIAMYLAIIATYIHDSILLHTLN